MPFCEVAKHQGSLYDGVDASANNSSNNNGIKIFYRTYGHGTTKVLLVIGLAGTHGSWGPQIKGLTGEERSNDDDEKDGMTGVAQSGDNGEDVYGGNGVQVCAFDNRGMGRSSVPTKNSEYSTKIMAKDAIALMDHLGWKKAHVFGHSMGAMIACKLAAMVPDRVLSLALLNVTGGGFECLPKLDRRTISVAIRFLKAKTPEQRAAVDLDTHYTKEYLDEYVGPSTRRAILYQEYVKSISSTGMQSSYGFDGQVNACWTHKMTRTEIELIRSAGFLVSVMHGRHDIIAPIYYARRLAEKLLPVARMVDLHGGHLVSHERTKEVNQALHELINASETKMSPQDWSNFPKKSSRWSEKGLVLGKTSVDGKNNIFSMVCTVEKLHLSMSYVFGLFMFMFEYTRRGIRSLQPTRGLLACSPSAATPCDHNLGLYTFRIKSSKANLAFDFEVDFGSEENASIIYAALAVDKELQPDKVKRLMSVSDGKLSVHFEAVEARFLRASFSSFVDILTLSTKTIEEFGNGMAS
uniref:AB hydrolase-1 domain-containing protein n=1 Tax=Salix viminalis TaxID=40686 RepID=A0A6N2LKL1_SALVM